MSNAIANQAASKLGINSNQANPGAGATIRPDGLVTFILDSDIKLACEDQARCHAMTFEVWLQQTLNDAIRAYIGA